MNEKYYYIYLGNAGPEPKSVRFLVESEQSPNDMLANFRTFSGRVVARNGKAPYQLGEESNAWTNPVACFKDGDFQSFSYLREMQVGIIRTNAFDETSF